MLAVVNDLNLFWTSITQAVTHHERVRRDTVTERHPLWLSTTPSATILLTASGLDRRTLLRGSSPSRRGSLGVPRVKSNQSSRGYRTLGLKDKTCWFCSDFSACWCGKINIEGGCFIVGYEYPHMPGVRANTWPGMDTQLQGRSDGAAPRAQSARSAALIPRLSILMSSWPGCWVVAVRWICLVGAVRFVGVVSRCGSYGLSARSSMRFMRSSSLTASTWAQTP